MKKPAMPPPALRTTTATEVRARQAPPAVAALVVVMLLLLGVLAAPPVVLLLLLLAVVVTFTLTTMSTTPKRDGALCTAKPLLPPACLQEELPREASHEEVVRRGRDELQAVLRGDPRLVLIVGPPSVDDPAACLEFFAGHLVLLLGLFDGFFRLLDELPCRIIPCVVPT